MNLVKYGFMVPLIAAAIMVLSYTVRNIKSRRVKRKYRLFAKYANTVKKLIMPGKESKLHRIYTHMLRYTKWEIEDIYKAKVIIFISVFLMLSLIKLTNISLYTKEILNKFDYHKDLLYQGEVYLDQQLAFEQEMKYFRQSLRVVSSKIIEETPKDQIEDTIKSIIDPDTSELLQPKDTIANKVYYRVYDYYKCRQWNTIQYFLLAFLLCYSVELILLLYNFFAETESKKELRFLKKLIILNGSIKPVDFLKLLKVLSDKASYHKRMLVEIEEMNKRNSVDNRKIYHALISSTRNIELKLFYEKLDQANNYEFNQAIINIENEFQMDRRAQARKIKKQTELIHAIGITGFMALVFILILYMIIPWLEMYNMHQIY